MNDYGGKVVFEFASSKAKSYSIIDANNCEKVFMKVITLIMEVINLKM